MTSPSDAGPPPFIPTLSDVLVPPGDAGTPPLPDAARHAAVQDEVVAQVMARLRPLLAQQLQDALAHVVQREAARVAHQIEDEIERVVRQCTQLVVAPQPPPPGT